jgi:hypothetical protein
MTIDDMKLKKAAAIVVSLIVSLPMTMFAQARPPVATAARAIPQQVPVVPTGPMTATTKAAAAIRASRAAQRAAVSSAAGTASATGLRSTSVVGYLWTANNSAITDATVQLRNTVTGQVELFTQTNAIGEFTFNNVTGGSYVIEYASDQAGSLLALGHPFSVAPGETVATFVRMSNALPVFIPDVAGNVASAAVQSAASAGVTAVVTPIAPVVEPQPPPSSSVR